MIEKINLWLKSKTPKYSEGVALYVAYGTSLTIKHRLLQGDTPSNRNTLFEELTKIVNLNKPVPTIPPASEKAPKSEAKEAEVHIQKSVGAEALAAATRAEANKTWKELMNKRVVLFGLCRSEAWEDENSTDRVELRGRLALEIISFNRKVVNPAYETLAYVEQYGRLPEPVIPNDESGEDDYSLLPDVKVKPTIDNIRKNLNKLRKREPTAERLALIKRHEQNLEKLLNRWHSLK